MRRERGRWGRFDAAAAVRGTSLLLGLGALTAADAAAASPSVANAEGAPPPATAPAPPVAPPEVDEQRCQCRRCDGRAACACQPWPALAAVVPGVALHGAGSWALGDRDTAKQLLAYEAIGAGTFVGSISVIALTGAARSLIGPLVATSVLGGGLFFTSLAADWYNVWVPPGARGQRAMLPHFESRFGLAQVYNPQHEVTGFVNHGVRVSAPRWSFAYEAEHAPTQGYSRWRSGVLAALWQTAGGAETPWGGVYLQPAFQQHELLGDGQRTWTAELALNSRWDTALVSPALHGAFVEFGAGYAQRFTRLLEVDADSLDSMMLATSAFGVYLPGGGPRGGEARLFYDHRHDGLVGGMLSSTLGSGIPGRVGVDAYYYLAEHFGLSVSSQIGAGWVNGLSVLFRPGGGRRARAGSARGAE